MQHISGSIHAWALAALVFPGGGALAQTDSASAAPAPAACMGPEFRQLDFWLGQWDVRWDARAGLAAGQGSNTVTRTLGGCVVQEAFVGGPSTGGLIGHSVSSFHAGAQRWRQTWVDNQGGHFALVGGPEGERFVLVASRLSDGTPVQRMVFEAITERSLTWRWQVTADGGSTWSDQWVMHYTRAQPPTTAPALADRLLSAIGARAAWAGLVNTVNDSLEYRTSEPVQVRAVITMDFATDGSWRSSLTRLQVNVPLPDSTFRRPE